MSRSNRLPLLAVAALLSVLAAPAAAQGFRIDGAVRNGDGAGLDQAVVTARLQRAGLPLSVTTAPTAGGAQAGSFSATFSTTAASGDIVQLELARFGFPILPGSITFGGPLTVSAAEQSSQVKTLAVTASVVPAAATYSLGPPGGFPSPGRVGPGSHDLTVTFAEPIFTTPTFQVVPLGTASAQNGAAGNLAPLQLPGTAPALFVSSGYEVLQGTSGSYALQVANARSITGEAAPLTPASGDFTVDTTAPPLLLQLFRNGSRTAGPSPSLGVGTHLIELVSSSEPLEEPVRITLTPPAPAVAFQKTLSTVRPVGSGAAYSATLSVAATSSAEVSTTGTVSLIVDLVRDLAGNPAPQPLTSTFEVRPASSPVSLSFSGGLESGGARVLPAGAVTITATFVDPPIAGSPPRLRVLNVRPPGASCLPTATLSGTPLAPEPSATHRFGLAVSGDFGCEGVRARLRLDAVDAFGNGPSRNELEVLLDPRPPQLFLATPDGTALVTGVVAFSGNLSDATTATVTPSAPGVVFTPPSLTVTPGSLRFDASLTAIQAGAGSDAPLVLTVTATDSAGNSTVVTRPLRFDRDGDGLPDDFELLYSGRVGQPSPTGLDPGDDLDGDGLDARRELALGTDPTLADTDDDGTPDGQEVEEGTGPADPSDRRPVARVRLPALEVDPQRLVLDGSGSLDPRGRAFGYRWRVIGPDGSGVALADSADAARPRAAVALSRPGIYRAILELVTESQLRAVPTSSLTFEVRDVPPVARLPEQAFVGLETSFGRIALDASTSSDDNGDPVSYVWQLPSNPRGGAAIEGGVSGPRLDLRIERSGSYRVQLDVTSGPPGATRTARAVATVIGHAPGDFPPVARAGVDQEIVTTTPASGVTAALRGRDSVMPGRPTTDPLRPALVFEWSQVAGPGLASFIADARGTVEGAERSVDPRVRLPVPGEYRFRLDVASALEPSVRGVPDEVSVRWTRLSDVGSVPPAIVATVAGGVPVVLAASGPTLVRLEARAASPAVARPLTYRWRQVLDPGGGDAGLRVGLSSESGASVELSPETPGDRVFEVVGSDGGGSETVPVRLTVPVRRGAADSPPRITEARAIGPDGAVVSFESPVAIRDGPGPAVVLRAAVGATRPGTPSVVWEQLRRGSTAAPVPIEATGAFEARFVPVASGSYRFRVTASLDGLSASRELDVPVDDLRQGGNAGITPALVVTALGPAGGGTAVALDASGSRDRDADIGRSTGSITYRWRQLAGPARLLFDAAAPAPRVTLPSGVLGVYQLQVELDDGQDAITRTVSFDQSGQTVEEQSFELAAVPASADQGGGGGCALGAPGGGAGAAEAIVAWVLLLIAGPRRRRRPAARARC